MNIDDVFQGDIPESLVVGLVSSRAYSGDYTLNPYNFQHFNCNFAAFYVDGKSVPTNPIEPNYSKGILTFQPTCLCFPENVQILLRIHFLSVAKITRGDTVYTCSMLIVHMIVKIIYSF